MRFDFNIMHRKLHIPQELPFEYACGHLMCLLGLFFDCHQCETYMYTLLLKCIFYYCCIDSQFIVN